MVAFLNTLPLGLAILIGLLAFAALLFVAYWVAMSIPELMLLPLSVRYCHVKTFKSRIRLLNCRVKTIKKWIWIPRDKIYEKNEIIYKLMMNMSIETDSLELSVGKSDFQDYSGFLFYKFTCPNKEVRITNEISLSVRECRSDENEDTYIIMNPDTVRYCWRLKYRRSNCDVDKLVLTRMA